MKFCENVDNGDLIATFSEGKARKINLILIGILLFLFVNIVIHIIE